MHHWIEHLLIFNFQQTKCSPRLNIRIFTDNWRNSHRWNDSMALSMGQESQVWQHLSMPQCICQALWWSWPTNDKHMSKPHGIDETVLTEHAFIQLHFNYVHWSIANNISFG
jgi:hypothetical protein